MRRRAVHRFGLTLLCAGALAAAAAGCTQATQSSARRFSGDSKAVAQEIDDWSSAASKHDKKHICQQDLSVALLDALNQAKGGCQDVVRRQLDAADAFTVNVQSVQVQGNQATARVKTPHDGHDRTETLALVKESGRWHLAGLGTTFAPPVTGKSPPGHSPAQPPARGATGQRAPATGPRR